MSLPDSLSEILKQAYVGKTLEYTSFPSEIKRTVSITDVQYHEVLDEHIFISVSPYGHTIRLTKTKLIELYKTLKTNDDTIIGFYLLIIR